MQRWGHARKMANLLCSKRLAASCGKNLRALRRMQFRHEEGKSLYAQNPSKEHVGATFLVCRAGTSKIAAARRIARVHVMKHASHRPKPRRRPPIACQEHEIGVESSRNPPRPSATHCQTPQSMYNTRGDSPAVSIEARVVLASTSVS